MENMENMLFEVEKDCDKEGGKLFKSLREAVEYYEEQVNFCISEKAEKTCDDFEVFDYIQIIAHSEEESTVILGQRI